jgi:hypothetical protein
MTEIGKDEADVHKKRKRMVEEKFGPGYVIIDAEIFNEVSHDADPTREPARRSTLIVVQGTWKTF